MNYQTELMQKILTNPKAQDIIDYVSQIYGNSYVGLWLFQVIGSILEPVEQLSEQLQEETNPTTTELLIAYWEQEYGIQGDPTMTIEQRRDTVIAAMRSKGACNPARLANAISAALGGATVEILENTGTNQFTVNIRTVVRSYAPAIAVIEAMKPAHLTYLIRGVTQESAYANINEAVAMTRSELYALRASNAQTTILTPTIIENALLKIREKNPITGATSIEDPTHSDDGAGTVTLPTITASSDSAGTVTLNSKIVTQEDE